MNSLFWFILLLLAVLLLWPSKKKRSKTAQGSTSKEQAKGGARPPGPFTLEICYVDLMGKSTTRQLVPYKRGATNRRFSAWCSLRQERRTFVFSGIQSAIDLETGEVLSRSDVFKKIHPTRDIPAGFKI